MVIKKRISYLCKATNNYLIMQIFNILAGAETSLERSFFFRCFAVLPQFFVVKRKNEGRTKEELKKNKRSNNGPWAV